MLTTIIGLICLISLRDNSVYYVQAIIYIYIYLSGGVLNGLLDDNVLYVKSGIPFRMCILYI